MIRQSELCSLLIFEKLTEEWVREVHRFNSKGKKKKSYVIFRNCQNKKLTTLEELKNELDDSSCLADCEFKSAFSHDIVSNKVGANKTARRAAKAWIAEVLAGNVSSKSAKKTLPVADAKYVEKQAPVEKSTPVVEKPPVKEAQLVEEEFLV